jgi:hypothetical protein
VQLVFFIILLLSLYKFIIGRGEACEKEDKQPGKEATNMHVRFGRSAGIQGHAGQETRFLLSFIRSTLASQHQTSVYVLFCMGVRLGLSPFGKNIS